MSALVRARAVTRTYGQGALATEVLKGVDVELRAGELVLLMGPSGSGKTTLLSILAGLMRPTRGQVELCGAPISDMSEVEVGRVRREKLGFVFQGDNLFPALTALDNVAEVLTLKGVARREARARAAEALGRVGLDHRLRCLPRDLSGGEKQRVAVARALAGSPALVLGDEVTSALDRTSAEAVLELLRAHPGPGRAVLLVTHDPRLLRWADRVIEIEDGRIGRVAPGGASAGPAASDRLARSSA